MLRTRERERERESENNRLRPQLAHVDNLFIFLFLIYMFKFISNIDDFESSQLAVAICPRQSNNKTNTIQISRML